MVEIYTDGGCRGNPGHGGWAFILLSDGKRVEKSGGEADTTNNKMELSAVIQALKFVKSDAELSGKKITVITDSQYVKNGITSWIDNWIKNGWKTAAKTPVKNKEYWLELKDLTSVLDVQWRWVRGHSGDPLNEACDRLVGLEMDKNK